MKRLLVLLVFLLAGSASEAAPLVRATWTQDLQGIAISVTGRETFGADGVLDAGSGTCTDNAFPSPHVQTQITCPSGLVGASGSATATSYSVSLTMPLFTLNTFTTGGAINLNTMATFAGSAALNGGNSSALANQGIAGMVTVKVAGHAAKGVNASMQTPAPTTLVKLPLDIGVAGVETGYFYVCSRTSTTSRSTSTPGRRTRAPSRA